MTRTTSEYFDLLIAMRSDRRGAEALSSLDIIDTKAQGMAALIGGFSAAAFFLIQLAQQSNSNSVLFYFFALSACIALAISGLLCAASLHIINHFQYYLFSNLEGRSEAEKIAVAAEKILDVYQTRIKFYIWCRYCFFIGVACLMTSAVIRFSHA